MYSFVTVRAFKSHRRPIGPLYGEKVWMHPTPATNRSCTRGDGWFRHLLQEMRASHSAMARILGVSRGTLASLATRHGRLEQMDPIESAEAESYFDCPNVST
jgi:hypothetical protein